jgi:hypothetical protein
MAAMALTAAVGPVLQQRPQIGGVLAYDEPFGAPVRAAWQDFGTFRVRMDTSPWRTPRFMALVPNPDARVPLLGAELDRLVAREIAW